MLQLHPSRTFKILPLGACLSYLNPYDNVPTRSWTYFIIIFIFINVKWCFRLPSSVSAPGDNEQHQKVLWYGAGRPEPYLYITHICGLYKLHIRPHASRRRCRDACDEDWVSVSVGYLRLHHRPPAHLSPLSNSTKSLIWASSGLCEYDLFDSNQTSVLLKLDQKHKLSS